MKRILQTLILIVIVLAVSSNSEATLIDRGGGLIYDTDLDITWLQDANYAQTSGYDSDGLINWIEAITWADNLVYAGHENWYLPSARDQNGNICEFYYCSGSLLGHMYYTELGNSPGGLTNTGPFINLFSAPYWTSTQWGPSPDGSWYFDYSRGTNQRSGGLDHYGYAWVVHDGDIAAVPEPATILLVISALIGMIVFHRNYSSVTRN